MPKVATAELRDREYWTPEQAARVLGRGADFWRRAFDGNKVDGYATKTNQRTTRYILAESARGYLRRQGAGRPRAFGNLTQAALAAFDRS